MEIIVGIISLILTLIIVISNTIKIDEQEKKLKQIENFLKEINKNGN